MFRFGIEYVSNDRSHTQPMNTLRHSARRLSTSRESKVNIPHNFQSHRKQVGSTTMDIEASVVNTTESQQDMEKKADLEHTQDLIRRANALNPIWNAYTDIQITRDDKYERKTGVCENCHKRFEFSIRSLELVGELFGDHYCVDVERKRFDESLQKLKAENIRRDS